MKQDKTNRLRETNNALAREALLYGIQCERNGDFAKAEIWYTKASREGSQEGHRKLQRILNRRVPNAITAADAREYQRNLDKANEVVEKDKVAPSIRIPKEDERTLVEVTSSAQTDKERKKKYNSQVKENDSQGVPQTNNTADAETLYQKGREAEKKGKIKTAHSLYKESAQKGHRGSQLALGKMYLEKALKLLGDSRIDIDSLMALILNQETDSDDGADVARKEQQKRKSENSHQPAANKRQKEAEDTSLTPTGVLPNQSPEIPVSAEKPELPQYKAWIHTTGADEGASIEVVSIPEAPTDTEGSGEVLRGWEMAEAEAAEEPTPELKCAQTENSGCEIGETEEKSIDLSPPAPSARTGCFFCLLRDMLSSFFSQLLKH